VAAKKVDKLRMMAPGSEDETFGFSSDTTEYRYRRDGFGCHAATQCSLGEIKRRRGYFVVVAQL
jgi:hypothetical protein